MCVSEWDTWCVHICACVGAHAHRGSPLSLCVLFYGLSPYQELIFQWGWSPTCFGDSPVSTTTRGLLVCGHTRLFTGCWGSEPKTSHVPIKDSHPLDYLPISNLTLRKQTKEIAYRCYLNMVSTILFSVETRSLTAGVTSSSNKRRCYWTQQYHRI